MKKNVISSRKIIGNTAIDINTRNPRDGTTLLMHAIIIGDFELVKDIVKIGADIRVKDKDDDDAIDYVLIFQRYKITELLLMMKHGLNEKSLAKLIERKEKEARFMNENTYGKFLKNVI